MTIYEVSLELEVLENYYNKKYNGTQVTQIHHRFGEIPKETFKLMLDEAMNKCNGSGYVVITKVVKDGGEKYKYQYGFRCTCANGQHQTDSVPTYAEVGIDENYFRR